MKIAVTATQAKHLTTMLSVAHLAGDMAQARRKMKPLNGKDTLELSDIEVNVLLFIDAKCERPEAIDKEIGPFFDHLKLLVKKLIETRKAEEAKKKKDTLVAGTKKQAMHSARRSNLRRKSKRKNKR